MEPSQIFGGEEECQSSESGWTMYIGSPIDDDGQSDDGENGNRDGEDATQADPEDESDDSMASDASSGPSHYGNNNPWGNGKGGYGFADFQQVVEVEEECDDENKYCLDKKANKTLEKKVEGKKVEKKEMVFINGKGKSPVQGSGKVRKNYWVGKRK